GTIPNVADVSSTWSYNEKSPTGIKSTPCSCCFFKLFKRISSVFSTNSVCEISPFQNASNARFHSRFSPIRGYPKFELLIFAIPYFLHFLTYFMKIACYARFLLTLIMMLLFHCLLTYLFVH